MECLRFVEEKIGEGEGAEFRRHLASCPACARDVEELREVRELYRSASQERYPGRIPRRPRPRVSWVAPAVLALAMLAALGVGVLRPISQPRGTSTPPAAFFRVHLEPWAGEEALFSATSDLWNRLDDFERSRR